MKKITYKVEPGTDLSKPFPFQYGPEELADASEVEIIPVDHTGKQISQSVIRNVVLVTRDPNGPFHWYEASIHVNPK